EADHSLRRGPRRVGSDLRGRGLPAECRTGPAGRRRRPRALGQPGRALRLGVRGPPRPGDADRGEL
ncbi:MAG: hypothetical protein AVDCRST_MAG19-1132, partial [uncultured Thermomicrobiales bacterium]